jgi:hypothetical protein
MGQLNGFRFLRSERDIGMATKYKIERKRRRREYLNVDGVVDSRRLGNSFTGNLFVAS